MSKLYQSGEMMVWNDLRGSVGAKFDQLDLIADFEMGIDTTEETSWADIMIEDHFAFG
jgi:hypothetical protein